MPAAWPAAASAPTSSSTASISADFRGLDPRSFDWLNFSMGVREQIIFPDIRWTTPSTRLRGLDVTITTYAATDEEAYALLEALGMPFSRETRRARPADGQDVPAGPPVALQDPTAAAAAAGPARSREFGVCRICLRELAHSFIPGMAESSW